ncbi:SDR family NAD(P)-dependent oxidoreductase [Streptomyces sp. TP-A0356]|uniref:SDR family NAD(P)-dependent oxidoreductase n=1 Tax=Streptomyces sp. TP-A0356 TaxID=1359208 RepID=UPI000AE460E8|nr:SDR family oxidoreductase [Streptomyces sp. TP-A0356]
MADRDGVLAGKVVMITGASSGIGATAARVFSAEGASVVLMARREGLLDELAHEITAADGTALAVAGDVTSARDVRRVVDAAVDACGRLDGAFNNAGSGSPRTPLHLTDDAEYDRVFDVNVRGVWNCLREQIPAMISSAGGGAVVNSSSTAGLVSHHLPGAPYIAAKHAVIGLTKAAADQYGDRGVRVNALAIGATRTELLQTALDRYEGLEDRLAAESMVRRIAEPYEVARAAAWLLGDGSSFITGATVPVDGGVTAL